MKDKNDEYGEFADRDQQTYERLVESLDEEGYENLSNDESNKIIELITDIQYNNTEEFEELVKNSISAINYIRSQNVSEGFQCGECGEDITFGTNTGTGRCIRCESERD